MGANDRFKACFGAWILQNKAQTTLEYHREGYTYFDATKNKQLLDSKELTKRISKSKAWQ